MASLLSSLIMGQPGQATDKDKVNQGAQTPVPPTPPAGGAPGLPSIPPVAQQQPTGQQPPSNQPSGGPVFPAPPGFNPIQFDPIASMSKVFGNLPQATGGAPGSVLGQTKAETVTKIDPNTWDMAAIQPKAARLDWYLRSQKSGSLTSGADLLKGMQSFLQSEASGKSQTAGTTRADITGDDPFLKTVSYATSLYNNGGTVERKMADAYANGLMYMTSALARNDQQGVDAAKFYLSDLSDYTLEDFRSPKTQTYFAKQAASVVKPYVLNKSSDELTKMSEEVKPEAVRKKLLGNVLYDYVQSRFTDLRTEAQSGSPTANAARKTLNTFTKMYGDLARPAIEGQRDKQVEMFMESPQGRALIDDAYDQFDGQGLFNTQKAKDLVTRMGQKIKSTQGTGSFDPANDITPQELKDFFGQTKMKRYISSAIDIDPNISDEALRRFELDPSNVDDDEMYGALTPSGVAALYGKKDDSLVGDVGRAGRPDPYMYDLSSNFSANQTQAPSTLSGGNTGRIRSRAELAGAMASGLGLSEAQLEQAARKLFSNTDDISEFVNAGMNDYDIESDILPKVQTDIKSSRISQTGGITTAGTSTGTYNLLTDTFKAVDEVMPGGPQQSSWLNKKRALNDIAVQARNLEGTAVSAAGSRFAKAVTGEPDYFNPILPDRGDQVGRIQILQDMFKHAGENSKYRTDLQNLIRSAIDGKPYTGDIKMTPSQLSSVVSIYAKHLEEAATANPTAAGSPNQLFNSMFGIAPAEYNKRDLRMKILKSLQSASPSKFKTMSSTMEVEPSGNTRLIPVANAGQVIENASGIPGDTGVKGGRSSKTENAALNRVERSQQILGDIFKTAKDSILSYTNDIGLGESIGATTAPSKFKDGVVAAFDKAIGDSLAKYKIDPNDKPKFDRMVEKIKEQLVDQASTEWMKGTVTGQEVDNIFKQFGQVQRSIGATGMSDAAAPAVGRNVPTRDDANAAKVTEGRKIYADAVAALGGNLPAKQESVDALEAKVQGVIDQATKRGKPDYADFVRNWQTHSNTMLVEAKRDTDRYAEKIKNAQQDIATLTKESNAEGTTPQRKSEIQKQIDRLTRGISADAKKGSEALRKLQMRVSTYGKIPTPEDYAALLEKGDEQTQQKNQTDLEFRRVRAKVRAGGFKSLTANEKAFWLDEGVKRYDIGEENSIGIGRSTRLGFNSFLASFAGTNWTIVNPEYELFDDNERAPKYLTEILDPKTNQIIGHKLNDNVKFAFQWKKDEKTGMFTDVSVVATEFVKQGNNANKPLRKQIIETGVERAIVRARNFYVTLEDDLKNIDARVKGETFGLLKTDTRVNRNASKLSGVIRDIMELEGRGSLNKANQTNIGELKKEAIKGLTAAGYDQPQTFLNELLAKDKAARQVLNFSDTLRTRMADRINTFAGKTVRTPQEIQDDISSYFGTQEASSEEFKKVEDQTRLEKIDLLDKLGIDVRRSKDRAGNVTDVSVPTNAVGLALDNIDTKGKVRFTTTKENVASLRQSVIAKLRPLQERLQKEVDGGALVGRDRLQKIAEAKKLSKLAGDINTATSEGELSGVVLAFTSNDPAVKAAQDVARGWSTRSDKLPSELYAAYKRLADKQLDGSISEADSNKLKAISIQLNKHLRDVVPELGNNPLDKLYNLDNMETQIAQGYLDQTTKSDKNPFKVIFGEAAYKIARVDLPRGRSSEGDAEFIKKWTSKWKRKDKDRLEREMDIAKTLGLSINKLELGDVWRQLEKRFNSMSPKQWLEYTYGLPADARNLVLREYPLQSQSLMPNQLGEGDGLSRSQIDKRLTESNRLTITPSGHVVPAAKSKLTAPQMVKENRLPDSDKYDDALMWKIQNGAVEYTDILHDSLKSYKYEVKGPDGKTVNVNGDSTFTVEKTTTQDGKQVTVKELKPGYTVLGATESYTNQRTGERVTRDVPTQSDYLINGKKMSVPLFNRQALLQSTALPAFIDADMIDKKLIKVEPVFKYRALPSTTVEPEGRLGFRYDGKDYWIGRRDYKAFVDKINSGEIDKKNIRQLVTELVTRVRMNPEFPGEVQKYTKISASVRGADAKKEEEGVKIPADVQQRLIVDSENKGLGGIVTNKGARHSVSFLGALMLAFKTYGKKFISSYVEAERKAAEGDKK